MSKWSGKALYRTREAGRDRLAVDKTDAGT